MLDRRTSGLGRVRTLLGCLTALATLGFVLADAWSVVAVAILLVAVVPLARVDFPSVGERDGHAQNRAQRAGFGSGFGRVPAALAEAIAVRASS